MSQWWAPPRAPSSTCEPGSHLPGLDLRVGAVPESSLQLKVCANNLCTPPGSTQRQPPPLPSLPASGTAPTTSDPLCLSLLSHL